MCAYDAWREIALTWLVFLLASALCAASENCTLTAIDKCCAPLTKELERRGPQMVPKYTDADLGVMCRLLTNEVYPCLRPFRHKCDPVMVDMIREETGTVQFMCVEGRQGFLQHRQCFRRPELELQISKCNITFTEKITAVKEQISAKTLPMAETDKLICKHTDVLVRCVFESVTTHCGARAASWHIQMFAKVVSPAMADMDCVIRSVPGFMNQPPRKYGTTPLPEGPEDDITPEGYRRNMMIGLLVSGGVSLVLIGLTVGLLVWHNKRRRAAQQDCRGLVSNQAAGATERKLPVF